MKVKLKHVISAKKRMADGSIKTYYYHRLTRKRILGEPGTAEFLLSYSKSEKRDDKKIEGTLKSLIADYQRSESYLHLAPRTKKDYLRQIAKIEEKFGTPPIKALNDRRIRGDFLKWRDQLAKTSPRQADYMWAVMRRIAEWGHDRGILSANHFLRPGRVYNTRRTDKLWLPEHVDAFMSKAGPEMQLVMIMALHTGQRQGDMRRLSWNVYDGEFITLRQSKTGKVAHVKCTDVLKRALDSLPRTAAVILTTKTGVPWTEWNFRNRWREVCKAAGIEGLTFHDIRGTTVTILAEQGCTTMEIAAITGHTHAYIDEIIDTYASRTRALSQSAIDKFEQSWAMDMETGADSTEKA